MPQIVCDESFDININSIANTFMFIMMFIYVFCLSIIMCPRWHFGNCFICSGLPEALLAIYFYYLYIENYGIVCINK